MYAGLGSDQWVAMDFVDVLVHIFLGSTCLLRPRTFMGGCKTYPYTLISTSQSPILHDGSRTLFSTKSYTYKIKWNKAIIWKPRGNGGPKMPRFNMTQLFTICLITMIILFFTGGDAIRQRCQEATYTQFKRYVDKGVMCSDVWPNKRQKAPSKYTHQPEIYARCIQYYAGKVCGP